MQSWLVPLPHEGEIVVLQSPPRELMLSLVAALALNGPLLALDANNQRWQELTPRERQVAALACMGYTNDEIGSCLVISVNTVRTHMRAILEKYQVSSKAALRVQLAGWDFAGWVETELLPTGPLPPMD